MTSLRARVVVSIIVAGSTLAVAIAADDTDSRPVDADDIAFFENRVRPILVDACFECHGPTKQESGLRFDRREAFFRGGQSGPPVSAGDPDASLLIRAVRRQGDLRMPPPERLSGEAVRALEEWVRRGAPWPAPTEAPREERAASELWSLRPIVETDVPEVGDPRWSATEIDRFVYARLQSAGIAPVGLADRRTLLRRVTYDLTGLPPTPSDLEAFIADESPFAFERVVDRLLATNAYAEKWGRHWLDVVRYADTAGETADYPVREAYKYRNYVIESFASDKPYDRFVREQIAGDLLAKSSPRARYEELVTATGFVAISRRFGFDIQNYHHLTIQDTIDTLGQAVLGLTLGCARCHDHKYDPVSAEDYYALYGIFSSTKYSFPGSEEKQRPAGFVPDVPPAEITTRERVHAERIAQLEAELARLEGAGIESADALVKSGVPDRLAEAGQLERVARSPALAAIWPRLLRDRVDREQQLDGVAVWRRGALPSVVVNSSDATVKIPGTVPASRVAVHPADDAGAGIAWWSPLSGRVQIDGSVADAHNCGDGVEWRLDLVREDETTELAAGAVNPSERQPFAAGASGVLTIDVREGDLLQLAIQKKGGIGCDLTLVELAVREAGGRARVWDLAGDFLDEPLRANPRDDRYGNVAVWNLFAADPSAGEDRPVASGDDVLFLLAIAAEDTGLVKSRMAELGKVRAKLDALKKAGPYELVYGVVDGEPHDAQFQKRGEKDRLGPRVPRRFLGALGGTPLSPEARKTSGRAELAEWLVGRENPLTARVIVNRVWQHHFGDGLVRTENDFGFRGARPTHPELLDHLALRFVEDGWSIKALHRRVLRSQVYRLASTYDAERARMDPANELLWRMPRRRLSAEEIRDTMLQLAGNLDRSVGGAHPFPDVSTWGFTQHNPFRAAYATTRRSVYLMTQRIRRHPFLALFDGPDPNASTPDRDATTVPTQSLFFMNSPFVHEQSRAFARRLINTATATEARISYAFLLALGREPEDDERAETEAFLRDYTAAVSATAAEREELVWAAVARTLLARNDFLFVD